MCDNGVDNDVVHLEVRLLLFELRPSDALNGVYRRKTAKPSGFKNQPKGRHSQARKANLLSRVMGSAASDR